MKNHVFSGFSSISIFGGNTLKHKGIGNSALLQTAPASPLVPQIPIRFDRFGDHFGDLFGDLLGARVVVTVSAFSSRTGGQGWPRTIGGGTVAHPRYSLTAGSPNGVLTLSNTPSPHRGAGGLKTLRDTAAPLGFSELVARRRGSSIEDA